VCCSVSQCVAVCYSRLQCVAACEVTFKVSLQCVAARWFWTAVCFGVMKCVEYSLQRVARCFNVLQRVAMCCNVLPSVAV